MMIINLIKQTKSNDIYTNKKIKFKVKNYFVILQSKVHFKQNFCGSGYTGCLVMNATKVFAYCIGQKCVPST